MQLQQKCGALRVRAGRATGASGEHGSVKGELGAGVADGAHVGACGLGLLWHPFKDLGAGRQQGTRSMKRQACKRKTTRAIRHEQHDTPGRQAQDFTSHKAQVAQSSRQASAILHEP